MEKFFWADEIADRIIKENKGKKDFVCASGITPSGTVHIGNFREVITTELVARALKDKGKKANFIYSWDDYDRLRKIPENLPESKKKEFENYLGVPLSEIPWFEKNKSYARHFEDKFENSLKRIGIKPKFIRQSIMNKKCAYASLIKKALDNREKIIEILNRFRKESLDKNWMPLEIYCEKCKKDFTKIMGINGYEISYECKCGCKSKFDFRKKGIAKLKWRVDWPARWSYEKVVFEPGGNDHSVYGGSYMTGKEIAKEVYDYKAPMYVMYDFVNVKGSEGKMSKSLGNVITLEDVEEIYEPDVLRFLFVGTRPNKGFQISFDNDVIKIYDDFDELERKYYEKEANPQEKRIYEMSVMNLKKQRPKRTSFRHLVTLVQVGKLKGLSGEEKIRAEKAKNWIEKYAGDEMKFEIQEKVNKDINLSDGQKKALAELKFALEKKKINEEGLYNEFYNIASATGIKKEDFFSAAYNVLLNKNRGPRLAGLIFSIGKERVIKLLEQIR